MQHGAHAAPVVGVDELTGALPFKVGIVQLVVLVQNVQIVGQLLVRRELVHMYVGTVWRRIHIVLRPGAHNDGQNISAQRIHEKLLRNVVLAVGVLKRQIELVVVVQDIEAFERGAPRTFVVATRSVDINLNN